MPDKPTILNKEFVAKSRLFAVERLDLKFSNGVERSYERLVTPPIPAVMVVPILADGRFIMIREYAAGFHDYQLSLPKGAVDAGETLEEAANRELMEEAGYGARKLEPLKKLSLSPGYMGHVLTAFLAEDLYEKSLPGDEPEPIETEIFSFDDLPELIQNESFTEARALAALFIARDKLAARK